MISYGSNYQGNKMKYDTSITVKICEKHGPLTLADLRGKRCAHCVALHNKNSYEKNKEERLKRAAEYRESNREKIATWARNDRRDNKGRYIKYAEERKMRSPGRIREVLRDRGLTQEQYEQMIVVHDNRCAACRKEETRRQPGSEKIMRLCIDHCHETGKTRGLLCHCCNTALGKFQDDIEIMKSAIKYITKYRKLNG